jgi:hypothetical protein
MFAAAGYSMIYLLGGGGLVGAILIFIVAKMFGKQAIPPFANTARAGWTAVDDTQLIGKVGRIHAARVREVSYEASSSSSQGV